MARTTVSTTLKRVRRQLHGGSRLQYNQLTSGIDASTTSLTCSFDLDANLRSGSIINIELETMRVVAVNEGTKTLTVVRAWEDSEAVAHSANAEIAINPRFTMIEIFEAMVAEINSWGPALYRPFDVELPIAESADTVELPASCITAYGVIDARRKWTSPIEASTAWPSTNVRVERGAVGTWSAVTASGIFLRLQDPVAEGLLHVVVALPFDASAATLTTDLDELLGDQSASLLDVLEMGIKLRVASDGELGRMQRQAQDDNRRAEETPMGSVVSTIQYQQAIYRQRMGMETAKLRSRYPIRTRM